MMADWTCPRCGSSNEHGLCEYCGAERHAGGQTPATVPAAYREPSSQQYERQEPDTPCTEPGCTKTLREHIAEAKRAGVYPSGAVLPKVQRRSEDVSRPVEDSDYGRLEQRKAEQLARFREAMAQ